MEPVKIRINKIELLSKSLSDKPNDYTGDDLQYIYDVKNYISFDPKGVKNICKIIFKEKDKEYELAKMSILSLYEIYEFDSLFKEKENNKIPPELDLNFIFISYNTVRGVIFSELRGTYLSKAILPLMDVKEFREKYQNN